MSLGASGTWVRAPDFVSGARTHKVPGFSQVASGLPQGWPPTVGAIIREYGTGLGSETCRRAMFEESSGRTRTVLMGYAGVPACVQGELVWGDKRGTGGLSMTAHGTPGGACD